MELRTRAARSVRTQRWLLAVRVTRSQSRVLAVAVLAGSHAHTIKEQTEYDYSAEQPKRGLYVRCAVDADPGVVPRARIKWSGSTARAPPAHAPIARVAATPRHRIYTPLNLSRLLRATPTTSTPGWFFSLDSCTRIQALSFAFALSRHHRLRAHHNDGSSCRTPSAVGMSFTKRAHSAALNSCLRAIAPTLPPPRRAGGGHVLADLLSGSLLTS